MWILIKKRALILLMCQTLAFRCCSNRDASTFKSRCKHQMIQFPRNTDIMKQPPPHSLCFTGPQERRVWLFQHTTNVTELKSLLFFFFSFLIKVELCVRQRNRLYSAPRSATEAVALGTETRICKQTQSLLATVLVGSHMCTTTVG